MRRIPSSVELSPRSRVPNVPRTRAIIVSRNAGQQPALVIYLRPLAPSKSSIGACESETAPFHPLKESRTVALDTPVRRDLQ